MNLENKTHRPKATGETNLIKEKGVLKMKNKNKQKKTP